MGLLNLYRLLYLNFCIGSVDVFRLSIEPIQIVVFKFCTLKVLTLETPSLNLYRLLYLNTYQSD